MKFMEYRFCPFTGRLLVDVLVAGVLVTYLAGQAADLFREGHLRPETHAEYAYRAPDGLTASFNVTSGGAGATWNTSSWNVGSWS